MKNVDKIMESLNVISGMIGLLDISEDEKFNIWNVIIHIEDLMEDN